MKLERRGSSRVVGVEVDIESWEGANSFRIGAFGLLLNQPNVLSEYASLCTTSPPKPIFM